jgi:photosystem II stability/assembly factor-like uncharacterized protein
MIRKILSVFVLLPLPAFLFAQNIQTLAQKGNISFRGLSVVNDSVIWISGTNGTVGKSLDGGRTWSWMNVPDCSASDFRDIYAFNKNTAIVMAITKPAMLLRTDDGGGSWQKVFQDSSLFLDAMDFSGADGAVVGDPVKGKMLLLSSNDYGRTWLKDTGDNVPEMKEGEAFFAASGANIKLVEEEGALYKVLVSGGKVSRLYLPGVTAPAVIPIVQGKETTGANAIAISPAISENITQSGVIAVIAGGDFNDPKNSFQNCVLMGFDVTKNEPFFVQPKTSPSGYKSSIIFIDDKKMVACGTSGVDVSEDGGNNWKHISDESFHICQKSKQGNAVFLAGANGKIAQLIR